MLKKKGDRLHSVKKWEPRLETISVNDKRAEITDFRYNL